MNSNLYLREKVTPFNPKSIKTFEDLLLSLQNCGFQARNLGHALDILYNMVSDSNCTTVLSLSGAMIPAGMGEIICSLIENHLIDVIVSTGANITHDFVDAVTNGGHYLGKVNVDDEKLYELKINRIYDIFLPEDNYDLAEYWLLDFLKKEFPSKQVKLPPSEFFHRLGKKIQKRCILSLASRHNIPIFVPAVTDSEFSLDLIKFTETEGFDIEFKIIRDLKRFSEIIRKSEESGTIIIGGGTPRNYAQQIYPYLDNLERLRDKGFHIGYQYSIRIHTAVEYDGGLSGCTISESKSWGKYNIDSKHVSVWCDATIVLPFLISALFEKLKIKK